MRWTEQDTALDIVWADRLGEFFTDLDFRPFADAGHFPHHERPDDAAREIAAFLRAPGSNELAGVRRRTALAPGLVVLAVGYQ